MILILLASCWFRFPALASRVTGETGASPPVRTTVDTGSSTTVDTGFGAP
jgi:hypothetical protein